MKQGHISAPVFLPWQTRFCEKSSVAGFTGTKESGRLNSCFMTHAGSTSVFKIQWIIKRLSFSVQHFPPCTKGKSRIQQLPINLACHASNLLNSNAPVIRPTSHASHVPSHFQETHFDGANKNSFIYSTLTKKASLNDCSSFRNFYNEQSTFPYIYISRYH